MVLQSPQGLGLGLWVALLSTDAITKVISRSNQDGSFKLRKMFTFQPEEGAFSIYAPHFLELPCSGNHILPSSPNTRSHTDAHTQDLVIINTCNHSIISVTSHPLASTASLFLLMHHRYFQPSNLHQLPQFPQVPSKLLTQLKIHSETL